MKPFILFFALFVGLGSCKSQSYTSAPLGELIAAYERYCDEIIPDTIEVDGKVNYRLVPVVDESDNITRYQMFVRDTTWEEPNCPLYKDTKSDLFTIGSGSIIYFRDTQIDTRVKKQFVCYVKRRQYRGFDDNFWNFVKNYQ